MKTEKELQEPKEKEEAPGREPGELSEEELSQAAGGAFAAQGIINSGSNRMRPIGNFGFSGND